MSAITSIRIKVAGTEVDLSLKEAKALRDDLNELLGEKWPQVIREPHYVPLPVTPPINYPEPYWPYRRGEIICKTEMGVAG